MRGIGLGVTIMLVAATAAAQAPMFRVASRSSLPGTVGDYRGMLIAADIGSLDGPPDGIPDVITANSNGQAPVKFGNGHGGFDTCCNVPVETIPTAIALADFDHDGAPDLLVADSRNVRFQKGNNDGSFEPPGPDIAAGRGPAAILVTNVDGDANQNLDAIVIDDADQQPGAKGEVRVLLGGGDGTFTAGATFAAGVGSTAGVLGDFNRDGKTDVAVANSGSGDVSILLGDGTGGFTPGQVPKADKEPVAIAAKDLNGDRFVDLIVLNRGSDSISVLNGRQGGAFAAARSFPSGSVGSVPEGLTLADVNGDGKTDVVVANSRTNDASVLLGDGRGNFAPARAFVTDLEPQAVVAADFNSDGIPDVVTVNQGSQTPNLGLLIGIGDGSMVGVEDVITDPNPTAVATGDVNNDGLADLVVAEPPQQSGSGSLLVIRADQSVGFAPPAVLQTAGDPSSVVTGDFNADGRLDLAALNESANSISVFLGGAGGFGAARNSSVGAGASSLAAADWNGDGRTDLAVTRQGGGSTGAVEIMLANVDGSLGAGTPFPVGMNPVAIDCGDFNQDGRRDLAVANSASNDVSILLGNGNGTFQAAISIANTGNSSGPRGIAVADFDRDGADDFALAYSLNPTVVIFYGNGQGGFTALGQVGGSGSAVAARDVNGDLIPDVLVTDLGAGVVSAFYGTTTRGQFRHDSRFDDVIVSRGPTAVVGADVDGDGRYDVVTANGSAAGSASVLTNIGATPVLRGDGNNDLRVTAADTLAVFREFVDGRGRRIEDVRVTLGTYPAGAGIDANGDGFVTPQDALAVAHELFPGM